MDGVTGAPLAPPRAILFDWDNTLVDNWRCVQAALNAALVEDGQAPFTLEETKENARLSARDSFPRLFGERWPRARATFYEAFAANHLQGLSALEGADRLLAAARADGLYLAVVSNKRGLFLRREVEHLGWERFFDRIVGAGDAPADKPDPAPAFLALDGAPVGAGPAVWLVGDTDIDMRCAHAAGCTPILIETSFLPDVLYAEAPPAYRVADCLSLTDLVLRHRDTISLRP